MNGIDLVPAKGDAEVVFDPKSLELRVSGTVQVQAGPVVLYEGSFNRTLGVSFTLRLPAAAAVKGFPLQGEAKVTLRGNGAEIAANASVEALGGVSGGGRAERDRRDGPAARRDQHEDRRRARRRDPDPRRLARLRAHARGRPLGGRRDARAARPEDRLAHGLRRVPERALRRGPRRADRQRRGRHRGSSSRRCAPGWCWSRSSASAAAWRSAPGRACSGSRRRASTARSRTSRARRRCSGSAATSRS